MQPWHQKSFQNDQYKNDGNLVSRINVHQLFSTNRYGWFSWVFDRLLILPPRARILEVACGRGDLWAENLQRIPPEWDITLSDASPGMLSSAREHLAASSHRFTFRQIDIQNIPFEAGRFDAVIANHMLYYVSDKSRAFLEVLRVLKPHGYFFTTTVGAGHMRELVLLALEYLHGNGSYDLDSSVLSFLLENGADQLAPFFGKVDLQRYEDTLFVTRAEPLARYMLSGRLQSLLQGEEHNLCNFLEQKIRADGGITIFKDSGIFITRKGG